ncbi:hypothetical protein [Tropicimonas aquimaris]|uniref:Glycosyltransferase family 1 protein n=1 Tax=Tropicimonas aquimaris TaxID=914152 RepID=A0ABW3IQ88_9RHOB
MARIVLSVTNVAPYPQGGGHWWVFAQWALGLMRLDCEVWWMEAVPHLDQLPQEHIDTHLARMKALGIGTRTLLVDALGPEQGLWIPKETNTHWFEEFATSADLLLNFNYKIGDSLLAPFGRTALIDIDPGLLQFWIANAQISLPRHDHYFSTGETVGTPRARFPDCGLVWNRIRPAVDTESWTPKFIPESRRVSTISGWWGGGGKGEWIADGKGTLFENNKRVNFIRYADLPGRVPQTLELALAVGAKDLAAARRMPDSSGAVIDEILPYVDDLTDLKFMAGRGWNLVLASEVAGSPDAYRSYIQTSQAEFSCAKPSCMYFENAWVSDRTLCYLASGKPAIVQNTGPSSYLPDNEGMLRFSSPEEALEALYAVEQRYRQHCDAARALAESQFDAKKISELVLRACGL